MPTVEDVLRIKGSDVYSIPATATVLEATQKMNERRIGALVITAQDQVVGIFTERDVLRRVVAEQLDPRTTTVGEVMSGQVICCHRETDLDEVGSIMKQRRIRHVPVCCGKTGKLQGLISIGDLNAFRSDDQQATIHFLSEYIYGRA